MIIDIENIKKNFIQHYQLDKLIDIACEKTYLEMERGEYKKINSAFEDFKYGVRAFFTPHYGIQEEHRFQTIYSDMNLQFDFLFDNSNHGELVITYLGLSGKDKNSLNKKFAIYENQNGEIINFLFRSQENSYDYEINIQIKDSGNIFIKEDGETNDKELPQIIDMMQRLFAIEKPEFKMDLINYLLYAKPLTIPDEFLETYSLLYDDNFNTDLLEKIKNNYIHI